MRKRREQCPRIGTILWREWDTQAPGDGMAARFYENVPFRRIRAVQRAVAVEMNAMFVGSVRTW